MNNRTLLKYHSWLGLIAGLFLLVMGISGSILVFHESIDDFFFKEYEKIPSDTLDIDRGIKAIQKKFPGWDTRLKKFGKDSGALVFDLRNLQQRKYAFVHPDSGTILRVVNANTHFTSWLLKLHYSLHAGTIGRIIVFFVGVLFLLSLLTGIFLYRNAILKTFFFQTRIKFSNTRTFLSALHRYVGVWSLFLNLLLVITGIVLAYTVAKSGIKGFSEPDSPVITASVSSVMAHLSATHKEFHPTYIRLPLNEAANVTIYGKFDNDPFYFSEFYNSFQIDYETGEILGINKILEAPVSTRLNAMVTPLHYAEFGGLGIKFLYCFIGLSGPILSVTGFFIWKKQVKQKKKKKKKKEIKMLE